MTLNYALILILAGILVGFINTLAGGGSAISLSVLILLGLPANVANGTNRVAILIQNLGAVGNFKRNRVLDVKKALVLSIPAIIGSILGAYIAADINEAIIKKIIGLILIILFFLMVLNPKKWIQQHQNPTNNRISFAQIIVFFLIGIYGGFIHIGVGYALLAGIVLNAGYDLVRANAIKVLIILLWTPLSLVVFWQHHQINLAYGLIMGIGNFLGAILASQIAVKKGANFVRYLVMAIIIFMAAHLLGLIDITAIFKSLN